MMYVKQVRAKGRLYLYFDTGTKLDGKTVWKRLPDKRDPRFGAVYAALFGHRTKRQNRQDQLTLPALIDAYEKSPKFARLAANSKKAYRIYLDKMRAAMPRAPAAEIERRDMVALIDKMAATPAAANLLLGTAKALFAWGRKAKDLTNDPCRDIDTYELGSHEPWPEELLHLALAADDARVRLAVSLLYYTGQRIGDVCRMTWGNVKGGRVKLVQEKTGKEVDFPVHGELAAVLAVTPKDGVQILGMKPEATRRMLQQFAEGLGYDVVPHGLRKNAVNALLEVGCSVAETESITRQSLQMIELYARKRNTAKLGSAAVLKWEGRK